MPARRARGEGTIRLREDGVYEARVSLGYDSKGQRRRRSIYGKTRGEVLNKLLDAQHQFKQGVEPPKATRGGSFLDAWLDTLRGRRAPSTIGTYENTVRLYLAPWLGQRTLVSIRPDDLEKFYRDLRKRGVGARTILKVHATLRTALNYALRTEKVVRNVAAMIEPPAYDPEKKQVLSVSDVRRLLANLEEKPGEALFGLALLTQLREGELLALRWSDIDLDARIITVSRTLQDDESGRPTIGERPKTRAGARTVLLPRRAVQMLRTHRKRQVKDGASTLVFPSSNGTPLRRQNVLRRWLQPALEEAGLPRLTFHELRHTGASILGDAHLRALQQRLGHSSSATTADIYLTLPVGAQKPLADRLDELFGGTDGGRTVARRAKQKPAKP